MSTGNGGRILRGRALADSPPTVRPSNGTARANRPEIRFERPRRHRDWRLVIAGVGVIALGGLVGWLVITQYAAKYDVLVAARSIPAGHVFTIADLRPTSTSAGGLNLLQEADEGEVLGHVAAVAVPAGAPLVRGDVGSPAPGTGLATVAVLCKPGQFPPSLAPGDHVTVLVSQASGAAGTTPPTGYAFTPPSAVVVQVDPPDNGADGTVITLQLDAGSAATVAQASAAGQLSLAITTPEGS